MLPGEWDPFSPFLLFGSGVSPDFGPRNRKGTLLGNFSFPVVFLEIARALKASSGSMRWIIKGPFNIGQFLFLGQVAESHRFLVTEGEFLCGMDQPPGRLHLLAHGLVLEDNSIDGLDLEHLFKDLHIEIEIEEVSQVEGIGGPDHLGPEIAVDSVLKAFLQGKEPKSISLG